MVRFELLSGVLVLALCVYCLIDLIGRSSGELRNLPKLWWIVLVLLFPVIGSIAYLVTGRAQSSGRRSPHERSVSEFPEHDRLGRAAASKPGSEEEFLRRVRERAEEQRRVHRESRRAAEREEHFRKQRKQNPGPDEDPAREN
jgi:Phospholipase_D-nuclease N-terminal